MNFLGALTIDLSKSAIENESKFIFVTTITKKNSPKSQERK